MKCPVCKTHGPHADLDLQAAGFAEELLTCDVCGTVWAINHGMAEIVSEPLPDSFLSATTECVEADDYNYAA